MNNKAVASVVHLPAEELRALVTPVAETLATEAMIKQSGPLQKKFSISDLRNIQRKSRTRGIVIR